MSNPFAGPGFVHAIDVAAAPDGLRLLTFPEGMRCYSHAGVDETETIYNEVFVGREYLRGGVSLTGARCVVDAGANLGLFTLLVKSLCPEAEVFACEPVRESAAVFARNVALHGLRGVHLLQVALGAAAGARDLHYYPNLPSSATSRPDLKAPVVAGAVALLGREQAERLFAAEARQVETRTLSALIEAEGLAQIDLLKIDVEGDELAVLQGLAAPHWPAIRQVALEVHCGVDAGQVQSLLAEMGFAVACETGAISAMVGSRHLYGVRRA